MSDELTSTTKLQSEWYWVAPIVFYLVFEKLQSRGIKITPFGQIEGTRPKADGVALILNHNDTPIYRMEITGKDDMTEIVITESETTKGVWAECGHHLGMITTNARRLRRVALGVQFNEILDLFYQLRTQGKNPKLAEMARAANVNYDSLRQAKLRYDAERKKNASAE